MSVRHLFGKEHVYLIAAHRHREGARKLWRYFLHFPQPTPILCRRHGHQPTVTGTEMHSYVECRWCGARPSLVKFDGESSNAHVERIKNAKMPTPAEVEELVGLGYAQYVKREGSLSVELATFGYNGGGVYFKVGGPGSENDWQVHVSPGRLFSLFVSGENFACWHRLQRRTFERRTKQRAEVVAAGGSPYDVDLYGSRQVGLSWHEGRAYWQLWVNHSDREAGTPRWRTGSVKYRPLDRLFGEKRYWHTPVGRVTGAVLVTNEGTSHKVDLTLEAAAYGRPKWKRRELYWTVDWSCREGISTKPHGRGNVTGSGVRIPDDLVAEGRWMAAALTELRAWVTKQRESNDWRPEPVTVVEES